MPDPTQPTSSAGPAAAAGTPASAASAGAAPTTPAIDLNAVLAENKRIAAERDAALAQGRETRKFATQKAQEAAALRRQLEGREADANLDASFDEPAATQSRGGISAEEAREIRGENAEIRFKQNNPDWNEVVDKQTGRTVWDEVNAILFDDAQAADYAGRTPYLTLKNIHREVQYRRLVAAQKAAADAGQAATDANRAAMRARAAISGQSGGGELEIDIDKLTPQEMIDQGLVEFDPTNPPSHARGSLFREQ